MVMMTMMMKVESFLMVQIKHFKCNSYNDIALQVLLALFCI